MKTSFLPLVVLFFFATSCGSESTSTPPQSDPSNTDLPNNNPPAEDSNSEEETIKPNCWETDKTYSASTFKEALKGLEDLNYKYDLNRLEEVGKKQTLMNKGMNYINAIRKKRKEPIVDTLTMNGIVAMRQAFVVGTIPISEKTYPRAEIEEWEFKSEECVEEALGTIARIRLLIPWDRVSKSPMDYWQKDNKLYFLVPGGFYMLEEAKVIQEALKKNL